ncbi:MAG: hypothetical protein LBN95_09310 [Prevotellaceae bacterium]|jgi:hypothetical protein|nr:hypothetical protein [Prevotellaceae bacterium]
MKKTLFVFMTVVSMSLLFAGCSAKKNSSKAVATQNLAVTNLTGASYAEASGLKVVFLAPDIVDVYTGPNKTPLTCSYVYNAVARKGYITMPGDSTYAFDFTLSSTGILLSLHQVGQTGVIPMKKL